MPESKGTGWCAQDALQLYNMQRWGEGYVDVSGGGNLLIRPYRDGRAIDLQEVVAALPAHSVRLPALLRFVDILHDRVDRLISAFDCAMQEHAYDNEYCAVYPIKVNQQADVVTEIADRVPGRVGLEAGSKPELLAVLGLAAPGAPIICNGYKDQEYLRLAGIGASMGHAVTVVVEKPSELGELLREEGKGPAVPDIGLRVRLSSIAAGNWQNTGGAKSKFGLTSGQLLAAVEQLRLAGALARFRLLHLHLGSQIANIDDIERGIIEAARVYCDLRELGAPIATIDVGGGLGVDYEGTASRSFCSMNYGIQDYADVIVTALRQVCDERGQPLPALMSESGRALTAHHAVLVTDVVDVEASISEPKGGNALPDFEALQSLLALREKISRSPAACYQRACALMQQIAEKYSAGRIDLADRARAEQVYREICMDIRAALDPARRSHRELLDELREQLADKYFVNLSIFQSLPDVWALDQIFPVLPVSRLDEEPDRRVMLCDLTCDSDGRMDRYVDGGGIESTLPLHGLKDGEPYWLGFFMAGAYQEILGDMHNLFGDTDAVNVTLVDEGWQLHEPEFGDRAEDLLRYVHCDPERLRASWRDKLAASGIAADARQEMLRQLGDGLTGYTYLSCTT